jgi:transposase
MSKVFVLDTHKQPLNPVHPGRARIKDTAAVNATRWLLYEGLKAQDLPLETGSGGLTKYNRTTRHLPKEHWIDAACVGMSTPAVLTVDGVLPLHITATGHGCRQLRERRGGISSRRVNADGSPCRDF